MKAILEFNLPEDETAHNLAKNGSAYHAALWDLDRKLRDWLKYGNDFKDADEALDAARKELADLMDSYKIYFED